MNTIFVLIAALLSPVLLLIYIWKKDPQPEPTKKLVKAVLYGVGICFPVAIIELLIERIIFEGEPNTLFEIAVQAFIVAAIPEECFKLLALWFVLRKPPVFNEHFDGIVYAVCVGLGFAALENVLYIFFEDENRMMVAMVRALLSVPGHFVFAIIMGYYYSVFHFVDHSPKVSASILLAPVLAHGLYDVFAMSGQINPNIGGLSFFILICFCIKMHKLAREKVHAMIEKDRKNNMT